MAANKFATMVNKHTHKLVLLLVYAFLEWVLIALLLLNSLFSYLIAKFASYFGLQKPCLWCSRVDHILENNPNKHSYADLFCESHASEISHLGYCTNHRRLAESRNMCFACSTAKPRENDGDDNDKKAERDDSVLNNCLCSCCNERFSREDKLDRYLMFRHPWKSSEFPRAGDMEEDNNGSKYQGKRGCDKMINLVKSDNGYELELGNEHCSLNSGDMMEEEDCLSSSSMFICYEKEAMEDSKAGSLDDIVRQCSNASGEFVHHILSDVSIVRCHVEKDDLIEDIECSSRYDPTACELNHRLIPVELIDVLTVADDGNSCGESEISSQIKVLETNENVTVERNDADVENVEMATSIDEQSSARDIEEKKQDFSSKASAQVLTTQEVHTLQINVKKALMTKLINLPDSEEGTQFLDNQVISKALASNKMAECEADKDFSSLPDYGCETCKVSDSAQNYLGPNHREKDSNTSETASFDKIQDRIENLCISSEPIEPKEDKLPDTPTSIDSLNHLDKKSVTSERREMGAKESFDGSVVSEMEVGDAASSIEQLKTALKSERKILSVLYAELEEERSASAIAANQTMAMITRLQEEKAAMQMEALQYQRMMEEQSEYDQEALQLLNDLMVKREKEKQELEKELDGYRKKVLEYEDREKMRMIRRIRDGSVRSRNSSASCSHAWDSDDLSVDLNREFKDEDNSLNGHQEGNNNNADTSMNLEEIALDCVKHMSILDESLTEFEEERLSILDQLKALEEKLVELGDADDEFSQDLKMITDSSQSNAEEFEESLTTEHTNNEQQYDFADENDRKTLGSMAKKLLPYLDEADTDNEEGLVSEEKVDSPVSKVENESNKIAIVEEVDHVYERLQALEADREFLKNCMSSIKKGDKGMDLLQEILQHLRDLRTIELRMRSTNDEALDEVEDN